MLTATSNFIRFMFFKTPVLPTTGGCRYFPNSSKYFRCQQCALADLLSYLSNIISALGNTHDSHNDLHNVPCKTRDNFSRIFGMNRNDCNLPIISEHPHDPSARDFYSFFVLLYWLKAIKVPARNMSNVHSVLLSFSKGKPLFYAFDDVAIFSKITMYMIRDISPAFE